ncbi:TPR-MalT domain-containing protein [Acanthopleuribacter pedis]
MINLGNAYLRQGALDEAEKCFQYATFLGVNEHYNSGRLYELRAISELTKNNLKAAVFFAELAVLEYQKFSSYMSLSNSLAYLAIAKHRLGEPAQMYLDQAKAVSKEHNFKVPDWVKIVQAYINRCNDKAKFLPYFQRLLENESCYFLTGFYEGALHCP